MSLRYFYQAVVGREWHKMLRQKDRLASAMVRPLLWLWVIGGGMSALAGPDYIIRLLPGVVAMTVLFGGMVGGMSLALDKDAGTMRLLVSAPFANFHVLLAKCLAAAINAVVQAVLLMLILTALDGVHAVLQWLSLPGLSDVFPWVGRVTWPFIPALTVAFVLGALCCAALGIVSGVLTQTIDGFAVMMNFVIFPVFFFSGALYPVNAMPSLVRWVSMLNPFTYVVDGMRHVFMTAPEHALWVDTTGVVLSAGVLLLVAAVRLKYTGSVHWFRM